MMSESLITVVLYSLVSLAAFFFFLLDIKEGFRARSYRVEVLWFFCMFNSLGWKSTKCGSIWIYAIAAAL